MPKISVIVLFYNQEEYVEKTLSSVTNQTLKDIIIIIIIDGGSSDNTLGEVKKIAEKDPRIKIIVHETNKGQSQCRKDGMKLVQSEYVMFLDGDDYLELDACEKAYSAIKEKNVDIVQFGTNAINIDNSDENIIKDLEKFLAPCKDKLKGKNVFEKCFVENKYGHTLWNKIYKAEICKKAFEYIKDGNFPNAEDLYAYFVISYFADSYYGIEDKLHNYRFGAGLTGTRSMTLKQLENICRSVYVTDALKEFVENQKAIQYLETAKKIRKNLLSGCCHNWFYCVSSELSAKGFDILAKYWPYEELVSVLCENFCGQQKKLAEKIFGAQSLKNKSNKEIKTIGIFYHRYGIGGIERVMSLLMPAYIKMGYNVVLFTDEILEDEYELPESVKRVALPCTFKIRNTEYALRVLELSKYVKEYGVDVMCYDAAFSWLLLFDALFLKLNGIPVILSVHSLSVFNMAYLDTTMVDQPSIYKLMDRVTVLSRVDEFYYKNLGVNAVYLQNPIPLKLANRDLSEVEKNTVLWVGRLEDFVKRCFHFVEIMKGVVEEIPDAKLLVVGEGDSPEIKNSLQKRVEELSLQDSIVFYGATHDVENYYKRAEIQLFTSAFEGFPMVVAESKSFGIPLVMYELPHVETCRDGKGVLLCPQGDIRAASENIVKILKDEDLKHRLQKEARQSIMPFLEFDLEKAWKDLFDGLAVEQKTVDFDENANRMLRTILQTYDYGVKTNGGRPMPVITNTVVAPNAVIINNKFLRGVLKFPRKARNGFAFLKKNGLRKTVQKTFSVIRRFL